MPAHGSLYIYKLIILTIIINDITGTWREANAGRLALADIYDYFLINLLGGRLQYTKNEMGKKKKNPR